MADDDFVEVVVEWGPGGQAPGVVDWLCERGLQPTAMSAGLLVTGDRQSFRLAFGVDADLDAATGSREIPVPPEIEKDVASISLPRPRHIQQTGDRNPVDE